MYVCMLKSLEQSLEREILTEIVFYVNEFGVRAHWFDLGSGTISLKWRECENK